MPYLARKGRTLPQGSLKKEIEHLLDSSTLAEALFILPTGGWARQLQRHAIEYAGTRTVAQPNIYSLQEFIAKLASALRPHKRLISDAEVAVLVELAIRDLFRSGSLLYYEERNVGTSYPLPRGTFELLIAGIGGLKQKGVRPDDLRDLLERKEKDATEAKQHSELRKLRDLVAIYSAYEDRLGVSLTDLYGQYADLADALGLRGVSRSSEAVRLFTEVYPGVKRILLSGFTSIDEPVRHILNAFDASGVVSVIYEVEDVRKNPFLFKRHNDLVEAQLAEGFTYSELDNGKTSPLANVLFNDEGVATGEPLEPVEISLSSAVDLHDEVRQAARMVKELYATKEEGYDISRIAVVMYRQAGYSRIVQQVFQEYGIPTSLTERLPLSSSPLFVTVDSLLKLAERGLSPHLLLRLLSTPYLQFRSAELQEIDRSNLFAVISEHRLPPGRWTWQEEFEVILASVEEQIETQEDDLDKRRLQSAFDRVLRAKNDIRVIESVIASLRQELTPMEFVLALRKIFYDHRLVDCLLASDKEMLRAGALEEDARSYSALDASLTEFLALSKGLGIESKKLPIGYYGERLRASALKSRYAPHLEPGRGVLVTSIEQVIGMDIDHVVVLGMNDGVFPELYQQSALVPREHSKEENDHLAEQRFLFYQLLTTPNRSIHISYERGAASEERLPSPFVRELERVADITSPVIAKHRILSAREFLEHYARIAEADRSNLLSNATPELQSEIKRHVKRVAALRSDRGRKEQGKIPLETLSDLERKRLSDLRNRIYSVSQLETYALCPFKYFEKYVLNIGETETGDVEEGLSAADRGVILHDKLRRILSRIRELRSSDPTLDHRNMNADEFRSYDTDPDAETDRHGGIRARHPFWRLDLEATFDSPYAKDLFEQFLEEEKKIFGYDNGKRLQPYAFEQQFEGVELPHPDSNNGPALRLRGKIDRVDYDPDAGHLVVIDYKTKNAPSMNDIEEGLSLQLPLYLRIAEDLIAQHTGVRGVAAYYHTLMGKNAERTPALGAKDFLVSLLEKQPAKNSVINKHPENYEELTKAIDKTVAYAYSYVEGMTEGHFPLIREDRTSNCSYCPYRTSCRVHEAAEAGWLPKADA